MKWIALLFFISCNTFATESLDFVNLGKMVSESCEGRSLDVKTAVHMRDEGAAKDEILKKFQRPKEFWSIGNYLVDQIFQLNDKSPENFYQFALHTCQVYYWNLAQGELCPEIFQEDEGANCLKASSQTSKDMMLRSFKHLRNS